MLNPSLNYVGTEVRVEFKGDCLKQKNSFDYRKAVNIYNVYKIHDYLELVQLNLQNILILISLNIVEMLLNSIEKQIFQLVIKLVRM